VNTDISQKDLIEKVINYKSGCKDGKYEFLASEFGISKDVVDKVVSDLEKSRQILKIRVVHGLKDGRVEKKYNTGWTNTEFLDVFAGQAGLKRVRRDDDYDSAIFHYQVVDQKKWEETAPKFITGDVIVNKYGTNHAMLGFLEVVND
jgi:hypothetical protein